MIKGKTALLGCLVLAMLTNLRFYPNRFLQVEMDSYDDASGDSAEHIGSRDLEQETGSHLHSFRGGSLTSGPTSGATLAPTTSGPTSGPTGAPTNRQTASPTSSPTGGPTLAPTTAGPTDSPTAAPTDSPTAAPTDGKLLLLQSLLRETKTIVDIPRGTERDTIVGNDNRESVGHLNFVHIPKAGGSTIERLALTKEHQCGLWGSRMDANATLAAEHSWGSGYWAPQNITSRHVLDNNKSASCYCAEWHLPPSLLGRDLREKLYPNPETFCILRHPLERLISYYYYHHKGLQNVQTKTGDVIRAYGQGPCYKDTSAHMNEILRKNLKIILSEKPCWYMCHLMPQTAFMKGYGYNKNYLGEEDDSKNCKHVLVLNKTIGEQFDRLMERFQCPIRFFNSSSTTKVNAHDDERSRCSANPSHFAPHNRHMMNQTYTKFRVSDLEADVLAMAEKLYADDIALYERLVTGQEQTSIAYY